MQEGGGASLKIVGFARDPRDEPKTGDLLEVITRKGIQARQVVRCFDNLQRRRFVVYRMPSGGCATVALDGWKVWAKVAHLREVAR